MSGPNGSRTVGSWMHDANGRPVARGVLHGNVLRIYDRNGRLVGSSIINGRSQTNYDARGRFIGTAVRDR